MNYLFLYMHLRAQAANASTNWTNWKNATRAILGLSSLSSLCCGYALACVWTIGRQAGRQPGAGPSQHPLIRGRNEREIAPVCGLPFEGKDRWTCMK